MPQFCIATSVDNGKEDYNADGCNGCPGKKIAGVRLNAEPLVTLENHMGNELNNGRQQSTKSAETKNADDEDNADAEHFKPSLYIFIILL